MWCQGCSCRLKNYGAMPAFPARLRLWLPSRTMTIAHSPRGSPRRPVMFQYWRARIKLAWLPNTAYSHPSVGALPMHRKTHGKTALVGLTWLSQTLVFFISAYISCILESDFG